MSSPAVTGSTILQRPKQPVDDRPVSLNAKRENEIWRELKAAVDVLKTKVVRVKSEGVKDSVEHVTSLISQFGMAREKLSAEWRAKLISPDLHAEAADNRMVARVETLERKVMGTLNLVHTKLTDQDITLAKLVAGPSPQPKTASQWTEVVKQARGRPSVPSASQDKAEKSKPQTKILRTRPLAVIVSKADEQFPELLRTVRRAVNPGTTGNSIAKMRQTKAGALLIEINGGADSAEVIRAEMERSLGPGTAVRMAESLSPVEIRDLDGFTTKEEVLEAFSVHGCPNRSKIVSLRKAYSGAQTAIVVVPDQMAKRLCAVGRIRVGLVYARIRPIELPTRCFRCLAFGHVSRDCKGTDRSSCCWRCGEVEHFSRGCTAKPDAASAFRYVLTRSSQSSDPAPSVRSPATVGVALTLAQSADARVSESRGLSELQP